MEYLDNIIREAQVVKSLKKRLEKLHAELDTQTMSNEARRSKYPSILVAQEKLELKLHDLHCEAVAAGVADYSAKRYGTRVVTNSFGKVSMFFRDPLVPKDPGQVPPTPLEVAIAAEKSEQAVHVVNEPSPLEVMIGNASERRTEGDEVADRIEQGTKILAPDPVDDRRDLSKAELEAMTAPPATTAERPAVTVVTLKQAQDLFVDQGIVAEGYQEISGRIYKIAKSEKEPPPQPLKLPKTLDEMDGLPSEIQVPSQGIL